MTADSDSDLRRLAREGFDNLRGINEGLKEWRDQRATLATKTDISGIRRDLGTLAEKVGELRDEWIILKETPATVKDHERRIVRLEHRADRAKVAEEFPSWRDKRADLPEDVKKNAGRIDNLEKWQTRIVAIWSALLLLWTLFGGDIKRLIGGP